MSSELFLLWGFWLMLWTFQLQGRIMTASMIFSTMSLPHFMLSWDLGSSTPDYHNCSYCWQPFCLWWRGIYWDLGCISLVSNNLSIFSCVHWLSMLPLQSVYLVCSLAFSWVIFLFSYKIFLFTVGSSLLKINWHFFLNLFVLFNLLILYVAQSLFLYIALMCLSPGWPGIPKVWAFSALHFPESTHRCSGLEQFSYWKMTMSFFFQCTFLTQTYRSL